LKRRPDWYDKSMKTAISLPDKLFAAANVYAQQRDMTRSELYAKALAEYLQRQRHRRDRITARTNAALAEIAANGGEQLTEAGGLESLRRLPW
jgi:metal-responsive CopG/Arc/MetJ family transcriptional regulator